MNELAPVIQGLLVVVLGVLTAILDRMRRELTDNTQMTKEAKNVANGTLSKVMDRLKEEQQTAERLREIIRELRTQDQREDAVVPFHCPYRNHNRKEHASE